jgi:hypothetical protein
LFTLGSFSKIAKVTQIFLATFLHRTYGVLILAKQGLGYIFGKIFTNSSGQPDLQPMNNFFKNELKWLLWIANESRQDRFDLKWKLKSETLILV